MRPELETGQAAGLDGAALEVLVQVAARRQVGGQERHHNLVLASSHMEVYVGRAAVHRSSAADFSVPIVQLDPLTVDQQFQLLVLDLAESPIVVHQALVDRVDLEDVIAVGGKLVVADQASAGAEGHAFDVIVLRAVFRNAANLGCGLIGVAHGQVADLLRRGRVAFKQSR